MFDVKPGASADGSSSPGPTPACRIVVDHHGGFVPAVPSLYKDEGAERLQSPNAATGKPLKKKTCTAAGTLLEVPLTPLESRAAPPQPIFGHLPSRRRSLQRSLRRSEGTVQDRPVAARPLPVEMGKFGLLANHLRAVTDVL